MYFFFNEMQHNIIYDALYLARPPVLIFMGDTKSKIKDSGCHTCQGYSSYATAM